VRDRPTSGSTIRVKMGADKADASRRRKPTLPYEAGAYPAHQSALAWA